MEVFKEIDTDDDGQINYSEFLMASLNRNALLTSERLEHAFREFDLDGNGELSVKEIKNLLSLAKPVSEEAVLKALKEFDGRAKTSIKFTEFKTLMQKLFE